MRKILKYSWFLLAMWLVITVLFTINQPDLKQIVNQKGEATIPADAPSKTASKMLNKMGTSKGDTLLLVFYDEKKLTDEETKDIETGIAKLTENKEKLQITNILDPFGTPEAKDQLVSKDNTTVLVQVSFDKGTKDNKTVINDFYNSTRDITVNHYITGDLAIINDYVTDVGKGVDKSALITVIFILVVLILMFRSVVTPLVSLLAVGVSYIASMGIIGILIHQFNFEITSFTQMFVILVLFGIGTDYHILLFNRFKEELGNGLSVNEAIVTSYKTAGKTIIYSGLTVFMGFASLSFVQFPVYRSANAVAIGIAVLLIEIMTLTPLLMKILAGKLFWPSRHSAGHKESKLWEKITSASIKNPVISLIIVAVILIPVIIFNSHKLSFDSIKDLKADAPSVMGFNIVKEKFGAGKAMPTTIVIESKESMEANDALAVLDNLTEKLKGLNGVKSVSGPTQPKGEKIKDLYTNSQTEQVVNGLSDANAGISKVKDGLDKIKANLTTPDLSKVTDLSTGTESLEGGITQISDGLVKLNNGIDSGAAGADKLSEGITQLKTGVTSVNTGLQTISEKLDEINHGYTSLGKGYKDMAASVEQLKQLSAMMQASINKIDDKFPNDTDVAALKVMTGKLGSSVDSLSTGLTTANTNYDQLTAGLTQLREAIKTITENTGPQSKLILGINELEKGAKDLSDGLKQGSAGQKRVIASMAELKSGAQKIKAGQDALNTGLNSLGTGMVSLKDGIARSSDGLIAISEGINKGNDFLTQLTNTQTFYIPKEAFEKADITKMLDMYMSEDRKLAKLTVVLDSEPYSDEAIALIDDIRTTVENELKGTRLDSLEFGIAGPTSTSYDLRNIATHDIIFTQIIVLAAIFILLIIVIKDLLTPIYIVLSLVAAYYASLSATAFISRLLFTSAQEGLSWNVPFFSFVMIAALGVDYSIFFMMRYKEYPDLSRKAAVVTAAKNIGGVVISAAVILAGTFATLYPSGIIVLMELAICVVIGLFLLAFVLLPATIPALMAIPEGKASKKTVELQ
ncbi:MAG: MmpL protein [Eubacterium sp.]|nr:MmpL protein [Eubacterium sp.]